MKKYLILLNILFVASLFVATSNAHAVGTNEIMSVVQIFEYQDYGNYSEPYSSGSGTIIDDQGYILTNHHVIENVINYPSHFFPYVCLTSSAEEEPFCGRSIVIIITSNSELDVAVLKIVEFYDVETDAFMSFENWKTKYNINFPYVAVDREAFMDDKVDLGDEIQILGYPGYGGSTITMTRGIVSGFDPLRTDEGVIIPFQIKTDAKVNPGNSGGAAFDRFNNFIGIPTAVAGGDGNIGYIIALPVINYILSDLSDINSPALTCPSGYMKYDNQCISYDVSCKNAYNQYSEWTGVVESNGQYTCQCMKDYEWNFDQTSCIPKVVACPSGQVYDGLQCMCSNGTVWNNTFQKCEMPKANIDMKLTKKVLGNILLQVESHGEAWYVNPKDSKRYYMKDGAIAYQMMRNFGQGITDNDLAKIPSVDNLDDIKKAANICSSNSIANRLKGDILLQVEQHGEAYYIYPKNCHMIYMKDGDMAYEIMRHLGLGITNFDLDKIPKAISDIQLVSPTPTPVENNGSLTDPNSTLTVAYADLEKRAFDLINDHRESIGASRLVWKDVIAEQARNHSINIAEGIIDPSHDGFEDRVAAIERSIPYNGAAENLAWNNHTDQAQAALDWWLTSPEHKASLENSTYDYTGIGVAKTNGTIYYFTQIFINVD